MSNIEQIIQRQFQLWEKAGAIQERIKESEPATTIVVDEAITHPVICLSREPGAGAMAVAEKLGEKIGCEIFSRQVIDHISQDLNAQQQMIALRGEVVKNDIELMVEGMLRGRHVENRDYLQSLCRVVEATARNGHVIILGRAASAILGTRATLRVRLTAPLRERVAFIAKSKEMSEEEAEKWIAKIDRDRRVFFQHSFGQQWDDSTLSDITINTSRFTLDETVVLILQALAAQGVGARGSGAQR